MRNRWKLVVLLLLLSRPLLSGAERVPPPESVFGFPPGADDRLATYDQAIAYFQKLAAASSYVKLLQAGKTTQGRTVYYTLVSHPRNLARIDRYRETRSAWPIRKASATIRRARLRARARPSCTSTAGATPQRWRDLR